MSTLSCLASFWFEGGELCERGGAVEVVGVVLGRGRDKMVRVMLGGFVRVIGVMYGGGGGLVEVVEEMFACVTCPQISDFCKSSY